MVSYPERYSQQMQYIHGMQEFRNEVKISITTLQID